MHAALVVYPRSGGPVALNTLPGTGAKPAVGARRPRDTRLRAAPEVDEVDVITESQPRQGAHEKPHPREILNDVRHGSVLLGVRRDLQRGR